MRKLLLTVVLLCMVCALRAAAQDVPGPTADFYAKYPQLRQVFPLGVYGGPVNYGWSSENICHMDDDRGYQFGMAGLRDNYINFYWYIFIGNGVRMVTMQRHADGSYGLTAAGRRQLDWMRRLDMYAVPSFIPWFNVRGFFAEPVFKNYGKLGDRFIPDAELDAAIKAHRPKFEALRTLTAAYGDRILAIANGDEPSAAIKANASSMRAMMRFMPNHPAIVVHNGGPAFMKAVAHMELVAGEAYSKLHAWDTRDQFLKAYGKSPNTACWACINAGSFSVEYTMPGFPDDRFDRPLVSLLHWQALAGGAKGMVSYSERLRPAWWEGEEPHIRNELGKEIKGKVLSALREFGRDVTAIGPLLLTCRPAPEAIKQVRFDCVSVDHFPYQGPALDCGVLQDQRDPHVRYLVVYNNNLATEQAGAMVLPGTWIGGKSLYDLHALAAVAPSQGTNGFAVAALPPGEGRIYMVGDAASFARNKDAILRHRTANELVRLDIRLRDIEPFVKGAYHETCARYLKGVDTQLADLRAKSAQIAKNLKEKDAQAAALYRSILDLLTKADAIQSRGMMGSMNAKFRRLADIIANLDEMIACFGPELLGTTARIKSYSSRHIKKNRELMADHVNLTDRYFGCKNIWWRGLLWRDLGYRLDTAIAAGKELTETCQAVIDNALRKQRRPIKVLFVTPNEREDEYYLTYGWLYKNFRADYAQITPAGALVKWSGKPLAASDLDAYDVVWLHRLLPFRRGALAKGGEVDPAAVFEPGLLDKAFVDGARRRVRQGKGLLLTGLFALYVVPLGYEKVIPDVLHGNEIPNQPLLRGFCAAAGFEKHPVFGGYNDRARVVSTENYAIDPRAYREIFGPRGVGTELRFDPAGFFTSGHRPTMDPYAECTWKSRGPSGRVVANVYDSTLGGLAGYAGIVEYGQGKGKVLVSGAMPFDLSPGQSHYPFFSTRWRCYVRALAYNMTCYLASHKTFEPSDAGVGRRPKARDERVSLPVVWRFALDPGNQGEAKGWARRNFDDKGWKPIKTGATWESQGYDYDGYAWYRVKFRVPAQLKGKRIFLRFGAVDEVGKVYLDGKFLGQVGAPPQKDRQGWAKPGEFDVTGKLGDFTREHQLSVQVHDSLAAGGIWKPVVLVGRK